MSFIPLNVKSSYSLMSSAISIEKYVKMAKELGYQALALTDENMYGAIQFYKICQKYQINPIIGLEVQVRSNVFRVEMPLICIALNESGYQDLMKISSHDQLSNGNSELIMEELLTQSDDLAIIMPVNSSNLLSKIDGWVRSNHQQNQDKLLKNQLYFGVSPLHLLNDDERLKIQYLSEELSLLALPEIRKLASTDDKVINALEAIDQDTSEDFNIKSLYRSRLEFDFLRSSEEYLEIFSRYDLASLCERTVEITGQVDLDISLNQSILPKFPDTEGLSSQDYLAKLTQRALPSKMDDIDLTQKRLDHELSVIEEMGFADYFLIVWDICRFAKEQGILMGPGRGSAAGSLVAYLLSITHVDPLTYDLLFERFLNLERATMPDIDLDFPDDRRHEILGYLSKKYGKEHVAQIITFGTFGAKSSLRDLGKLFNLSAKELNVLSGAVPTKPGISLQEAYDQSSALRKIIKSDRKYQEIFNIAKSIEGFPRHTSIHAAGVVLSEAPLTDIVPLRAGSEMLHVTQYAMNDAESVGLLKLDILALKNLTILANALKNTYYENDQTAINLDDIPMNDSKTLELFQRGDTTGIFQFESEGIRQVLVKMQPTDFEDLVAAIALYRPGPMRQIEHFIARKKGVEPVVYPHPNLENILEVTYGIMVYQEQVMKVASTLANYSMNEADLLRRMISKKDHHSMRLEREKFVQGVVDNGYDQKDGEKIFELIEEFADYGFNRSHAVAYAMMAYQLAYLKAHFPKSFYTALLQATQQKDKIQKYRLEMMRAGISFLKPNINESWYSYLVKDHGILLGFNQIKGLRRDFIQQIIKIRRNNGPFTDFIDFMKKIDSKWLNESSLKPLIYAGAFDSFADSRAALIDSLPHLLKNWELGQGSPDLLNLFSLEISHQEEYTDRILSEQEFEMTGLYLTEIPGEKYQTLMKRYNLDYISDLSLNQSTKILALVKNIKTIQTKNGEPMSFVDASDQTANISLTLFPGVHRQYIKIIERDDYYIVEGKFNRRNSENNLIVDRITSAEEKYQELMQYESSKDYQLILRAGELDSDDKILAKILKTLKKYPGKTSVTLYNPQTSQLNRFKSSYFVTPKKALLKDLKKILGDENVILSQK